MCYFYYLWELGFENIVSFQWLNILNINQLPKLSSFVKALVNNINILKYNFLLINYS